MVKGLALTAAGVALGFVAAFELTRLMGYLLYQVSPRDPLSFVSALVVLVLASVTACLVPALRATRTDPILALRG
jgi:ABC-type antimicrobial peptide transport system permease subunit